MMFPFRADLHMHSNCSDGTDSPEQLLCKAKEAGLQAISITDHDTVQAYTPKLFDDAKTQEILLLPGVELSSEFDAMPVHILGYGFDLGSTPFLAFLHTMQERRKERNARILQKLKLHGIAIQEEELQGCHSIGRPHIAAAMIQKGFVRNMQEAFDVYLKEGRPCFVPGFKITPEEAIQEIRKAQGKAVLAHPHLITKKKHLKKLLSLPFDGIECYYGRSYPNQNKPWAKMAKEKGWIATGGSDYHGAIKPHISIGCSWVDEATFKTLLHPN